MAENIRIKYSEAQQGVLVAQTNSVCPLCIEPLFYQKQGKSHKAYEIAHIYPLNPNDSEKELLQDEERLGDGDVNDEDNVIPLCKQCHGKFDKPRTVEEYRYLLNIKKRLIENSDQHNLWKKYPLEESISEIIRVLYDEMTDTTGTVINFDPKTVDQKCDQTLTRPTIRKIKGNVVYYYDRIRQEFKNLDKFSPGASTMISLEVKTYYSKQRAQQQSKQIIFENIVSWINIKTRPKSIDAAEILASFFVQNCEIFE